MKRKLCFLLALFALMGIIPAWAQPVDAVANIMASEPFSFVGMRLEELFERFGPPNAVFPVRGDEIWQDDVVFRYAAGDFFIHGDRIWQVRVLSAHGISAGDPRQAALLILGDAVQDFGDHLLMPLLTGVWPLMFRININDAGRVSEIFIYRPDF